MLFAFFDMDNILFLLSIWDIGVLIYSSLPTDVLLKSIMSIGYHISNVFAKMIRFYILVFN